MKIIIELLLIFIFSCSAISQELPDKLSPKFISPKAECSFNSNLLQSIDISTETGDLIIIISHSGKTEKKEMSDRRLYNARTFLTRMSIKGRSPQRVITSKGDESAAEGYLDFFVEGRLELRVNFPKNRDLTVQPCFEDPEQKPCSGQDGQLYYPCKAGESQVKWRRLKLPKQ